MRSISATPRQETDPLNGNTSQWLRSPFRLRAISSILFRTLRPSWDAVPTFLSANTSLTGTSSRTSSARTARCSSRSPTSGATPRPALHTRPSSTLALRAMRFRLAEHSTISRMDMPAHTWTESGNVMPMDGPGRVETVTISQAPATWTCQAS